jgi:hypothetical protein
MPSHIYTMSDFDSVLHVTPSPLAAQTVVPLAQLSLSVPSHAEPRAAKSSSTEPSQSSSTALQNSAAGVRALHPTNPSTGLHIAVPVQVPKVFLTVHACVDPAVAAVHAQSLLAGMQYW